MKILDNSIVRDMTSEEEAAFIAMHENQPESPDELPTAQDKAEAYDILMGVNE